ncbi:hypothetical protein GCM10009804_74070 [Kribbella hippodromi]|uniref:Uncharacterized protein n=1 Tax=Kribbella hippodromi TaxID=434347 RepID=A0ABN2EGY1_9ACTN
MSETWAPAACTLPTVERPVRVAEFEQFFADNLRAVRRVDAQTLDLTLSLSASEQAKDLTDRESECCSFFTFTLTKSAKDLQLRITVPPAHTSVLDGLTQGISTTLPTAARVSNAR